MSDEKNNSIYPNGARFNALFSTYAEIAFQNYLCAKSIYEKMEIIPQDDIDQALFFNSESEKCAAVSVVFSAMCIESFFNNYAAACLGDDEFYGSFDNLSLESKFQLIAKFILKVAVEKGKSYYSLLKKLVKLRNELVHNKSRNCFQHGYATIEEAIAHSEDVEESDITNFVKSRKTFAQNDLRDALDALKAIREIAYFFDRNDDTVYAIIKIFSPWKEKNVLFNESYKNDILKELRIKAINQLIPSKSKEKDENR